MEYFTEAKIRFKGECDVKALTDTIKKAINEDRGFSDTFQITKTGDKVEIELLDNFEFSDVRALVDTVLATGLKKFGRDKLIAYQTCAECHFKNYVTKDGKFLDFCGDCP